MSKKTITICDGCGKILERKSEIYHLDLKTDRFWDGVEMDCNSIRLDLCIGCARDIKNTLRKICQEKQEGER